MTRPKRPSSRAAWGSQSQKAQRKKQSGGPEQKGSRGHAPKKMSAQGRGGITREGSRPVRGLGDETPTPASGLRETAPTRSFSGPRKTDGLGRTPSDGRRYGTASGGSSSGSRGTGGRTASGNTTERKAPPRINKTKSLPELKRVQLDAPDPGTVFRDRDGQEITFPDSILRRVAAQILTEKRKAWRFRPFAFPIFTDKGHEQSFSFDFYIYDAEDSVIRLILVVPHESRELWDKVGRFKRQFPMYAYELWTPEKLAQLSGPRGRLGF